MGCYNLILNIKEKTEIYELFNEKTNKIACVKANYQFSELSFPCLHQPSIDNYNKNNSQLEGTAKLIRAYTGKSASV